MNSDASSNEDFYARLGIDPPVKVTMQVIRERDAERAQFEAALLRRVNATTAIRTTAAPLR
jgi:hypothetical protein